jgi:hypothetical protein
MITSHTPFVTISYIFMEFVSVSDLLDYINPNHDTKGRDAAAKRRNQVTKVPCRFSVLDNLLISLSLYELCLGKEI